MTLDERYEWLQSIATQADTLFAQPEDMLMVAGMLFTSAVAGLPKAERDRTIRDWVHHARHAIRVRTQLADTVQGPPRVSRH